MAQLTERMKEILNKQETITIATATKEGIPNSVPVSAKKVLDDETILISDQFMGKTLDNLKANPYISFSFWDGFEGYQVKGSVSIETSGKRFEETAQWIEGIGKQIGVPLKSKGALIVSVKEIYAVSPGPDAGKKIA